jgi:hypothetical protein
MLTEENKTALQLDFTKDNSPMGLLKQEIEEIRNSLSRQRKKQFSLLSGFGKSLVELKAEIDSMKSSKVIKMDNAGEFFAHDRTSVSVCAGSDIGRIVHLKGER